MEKFIPLEKRSKKEQRRQNAARRGDWNGLNPVTRKPANPRAYQRSKARKESDGSLPAPCAFFALSCQINRETV